MGDELDAAVEVADAGFKLGGDGGVVHAPSKDDAGASKHPPPPAANDAGAKQTDGGTKPPPKDGGSGTIVLDSGSTTTTGADDSGTTTTTGDDAGGSSTGSGGGSTGSGSGGSGSWTTAECITGDDCFSIPCDCGDGTTEYWQACGADGQCLGYGVCLNDSVCADHGGLFDPTAPPASCDPGDPSDCATVACACADGTTLDYQGCNGTSCATTASCGAAGDDVCSAHGGWVGDSDATEPCADVVCTCPDGVTYTVPDEQCLGSGACATYLTCSGD
jgi:hypothetical protein